MFLYTEFNAAFEFATVCLITYVILNSIWVQNIIYLKQKKFGQKVFIKLNKTIVNLIGL